MAQIPSTLCRRRGYTSARNIWPVRTGPILLQARVASGAQAGSGPASIKPSSAGQIFTFLFLMLGPTEVVEPFAGITRGADPLLAHRIAFRALLFSILALLL